MRPLGLIAASLAASIVLTACAPNDQRESPAAGAAPTFVVLTPPEDPSTAQFVSWRTNTGVRGLRVEVTTPGEPRRQFSAHRKPSTTVRQSGSSRPQWTSKLSGLTPATTYKYRIVTSEGSLTRSFTTASGPLVEPWTFLAFGDTQNDNAKQPEDIIDAAVAAHPDARLMLQAGDVVNHPWVHQEWKDLFQAMAPTRTRRNWMISIGNHEQCILVVPCRSGDAQGFKSYFRWPAQQVPKQDKTWFFVDYQGVRFVVIDSFGPHPKRQAAFLEQALKTNPLRWSVVLEHAAPFASRGDRTNERAVKHFLPVFERYDVDLVLSGHDHSYARGFRGDPNSTVYATSVSGPKFYSTSPRDWNRRGATRVKAVAQVATFQSIKVSENQLIYRATIGYKGSKARIRKKPGALIDKVVITKSGDSKTVTGWAM